MDKTKKIMLVVFATLLMMNLQFNTPLTKGMDDGFSLTQLVENVFVQESYAENSGPYSDKECHEINGIMYVKCWGSGSMECTCP